MIVGYDADLTICDLKQETVLLSDAEGETRESHERFVPLACVVLGEIAITEEGRKNGFSY
nr:hypothetical protein [Orbus hercynius]